MVKKNVKQKGLTAKELPCRIRWHGVITEARQKQENMLELQKKYHDVRMDRDKELYERQVKVVDSQINRLVYDLYGLTEEEVKVVEGSIK